jgi:hypothetical protein
MFETITSETFSMPICIIGPLDETLKRELKEHIQLIGMDFLEYHFDFFDIASARDLAGNISQKSEMQSCLFYSIHSTNRESQNTLLKNLEDYGGTTPLILSVPYSDVFLPTIMSRCYLLDIRPLLPSVVDVGFDWIKWFEKSGDQRIKALAEMRDDMTLSLLRNGVDVLEKQFHNNFSKNHSRYQQLSRIQNVREWLASPNPSLTMIGEYMSLML